MRLMENVRARLGKTMALTVAATALLVASFVPLRHASAGNYLGTVSRPLAVVIDGTGYYTFTHSGGYSWAIPTSTPGADGMFQAVLTAYEKGQKMRVSCQNNCRQYNLDMSKVGYTGVWTFWNAEVIDLITW